jgi:hypothetical protein
MGKVIRIYKPDTRALVSTLPGVGAQRKQLIEIFESIKPAVLTQSVTCDGTNFADLGMYFACTTDRKYCLKVECNFADADLDGVVQLSLGPIANIAEFKQIAWSLNSDSSTSIGDEVNNYTGTLQGTAWVPSTETAVVQGYATIYFQIIETCTLSLSFLAGQGDTTMLAASNFTLTEIDSNDQ